MNLVDNVTNAIGPIQFPPPQSKRQGEVLEEIKVRIKFHPNHILFYAIDTLLRSTVNIALAIDADGNEFLRLDDMYPEDEESWYFAGEDADGGYHDGYLNINDLARVSVGVDGTVKMIFDGLEM